MEFSSISFFIENHQENYNSTELELCKYPVCLRLEAREKDLVLRAEQANSACRINAIFEEMQNLGLINLYCMAIESCAC